MKMGKRVALALASAMCLAVFPAISAYAGRKEDASRRFQKRLRNDQRIQQALNRLTFGPRPDDVAFVKSIGLKKWIDLQLHPERVPENPVLAAKLRMMDTLSM